MSLLEKEFIVKEEHTALSMGSGDLLVLATPAVVAFAENTCKSLIEKKLTEGETTVGMNLEINHIRPTKVGEIITVKAVLNEQNGRILLYEFAIFTGELLVAEGTHKRAIVDAKGFMSRLEKKKGMK